MDFTYHDLRTSCSSADISLLFPGWQKSGERIVILSPHDDDALLGAGYLTEAAHQEGGEVWVVIVCDGRAGYSTPEERETIVATRHQETLDSYAALGVPAERIVRLDVPDFGVWPRIGWLLPAGGEGTIAMHLRALRRIQPTRLLIPNGHREHIDHTAAFFMGSFDAPQVGDPILADWGTAPPVRTTMVYSVWADFSPEDALVEGCSTKLRANRALSAPPAIEQKIERSLRLFRSQLRIIDGLMAARAGRIANNRAIELYQAYDARPALNYAPYHEHLTRKR